MASNYPTSLDNFTNPTSNDSLNSPSHSLQHADINDAVEAIEAKLGIGASAAGSAVSGYVLTAGTGGTTTWSAPSIAGLTLVKAQTIGSAVSSVEVTGAFSSTYDNYRVLVSGGAASNDTNLFLTLGSTATDYYEFKVYGSYDSNTVTGEAGQNITRYASGRTSANGHFAAVDIFSPNLANRTFFGSIAVGGATAGVSFFNGGFLNNATQYTSFTITPGTGTLTGGIIRVYGYRNS